MNPKLSLVDDIEIGNERRRSFRISADPHSQIWTCWNRMVERRFVDREDMLFSRCKCASESTYELTEISQKCHGYVLDLSIRQHNFSHSFLNGQSNAVCGSTQPGIGQWQQGKHTLCVDSRWRCPQQANKHQRVHSVYLPHCPWHNCGIRTSGMSCSQKRARQTRPSAQSLPESF